MTKKQYNKKYAKIKAKLHTTDLQSKDGKALLQLLNYYYEKGK